MCKLGNVIFYKNSWGSHNVIKKMYDIENIPEVGEIIVLLVDGMQTFYIVVERIFDFADDVVHFRVNESSRVCDLAVM